MYTLTVEYTGTEALTAVLASSGAGLSVEFDGIVVYDRDLSEFLDIDALVDSINTVDDLSATIDGGGAAQPDSMTVGVFDLAAAVAQLTIQPVSLLSPIALMTWAQAQTYLNVTDEERFYIEGLINAVTSAAERYYAKRPLRQRQITRIIDGDGSDLIMLETYPIDETSVDVRVDSTRAFAVSTAVDVLVYEDTGIIVRDRGRFPAGRQNIRLDYIGGYDPVPLDLVMACAESVAYQRGRLQQNGAGIRSMSAPNGINTTYELTFPMNAQRVFESYQEVRC